MAVLAVVWGALVAYELIAPERQRGVLATIGNVIWVIFVAEFVTKLVISGNPLRFLRKRWPSLLFLAVPLLRTLRLFRALRALRALPVARVVGSGYRTIGSAKSLLGGRLAYLGVVTATVVFAGGQVLFLVQPGAPSLGEALWWSSNLAITGTYTFDPTTIPSRMVSLLLSVYAVVVFASLAATVGAFFVESRAEVEETPG